MTVLLPRLRLLLRWRTPLVVLAVAAALGLRILTKHLPQSPALLWSGAMLVSFVGWGSVVNWLVWPQRAADWSLRAIWGVSVTLFLGGILCALHLARPPVLLVQINLGVALAGVFAVVRARAPSLRAWRVLAASPGLALVLGAGYLASLLWLYGNLGNSKFSDTDDYLLSFVMAKKVLATGTMNEPFAARRLLSFGGQEYLHALYLIEAPLRFIHGLDRGVFVILTVGLVAGAFTSGGLRARYAAPLGLALLALFWLPDVLPSTASFYSGIAALLGLWRTLRWRQEEPSAPAWAFDPRRAALLGVSAITCVVLRSSNSLPVVTFLALAIAFDYTRVRRPARSLFALAGTVGVLALAAALALVPWSLLMSQSSHGNLTQGFELWHEADDLVDFTRPFVASLFSDHTLTSFLVLALAAMVPTRGRGANDGLALAVASFAGFVAIAKMGAWLGTDNLPPYYFSYFAATAVALAVSSKSALGRSSPVQMARLAVIAAAVAAQVVTGRGAARDMYTALVTNMDKIWTGSQKELDDFAKGDKDYKDIQSKVPRSAGVAVAVLEPFRFDFKRNTIDSLDAPMGGMGPAPEFPVHKGPEVLASYLLSHGVRYLVFTDFGPSSPFGKGHWEEGQKNDKSVMKNEAPFHLDVLDSIEALSKSRAVLQKSGPMTLLDLGSRR